MKSGPFSIIKIIHVEEPCSDKAVDEEVEAAVKNEEEVRDRREDEHPGWETVRYNCIWEVNNHDISKGYWMIWRTRRRWKIGDRMNSQVVNLTIM